MRHHFLLFFGLFYVAALPAQVLLNEVVSSNGLLMDGYGGTPDWFELYNAGPATSLAGWTVTDERSEPNKYQFGEVTLAPGEYALVFAGGEERPVTLSARTLIDRGAEWEYRVPDGDMGRSWQLPNYNEAAWTAGPSGIGYGDGDDATKVPVGTRVLYLRKVFTLNDAKAIQGMLLDVDYDDGFVAYLNGREVARANVEGELPGLHPMVRESEARLVHGQTPERYWLKDFHGHLWDGENVLAIQLYNSSAESSDLSIIPFLTALVQEEVEIGEELSADLPPLRAIGQAGFKIKAGETLFLFNAEGQVVSNLTARSGVADVSAGRVPGQGGVKVFGWPTPGAPNTTPGYRGVIDKEVVFSHPGGRTNPFELRLSGASNGETIRYTTDGRIPDADSPVAERPLLIAATTPIRARIFAEGKLPSPVVTHSYIVDDPHLIDVVSLVVEPKDFFDGIRGIYELGEGYSGTDIPYFGSNIWYRREVPAHFSFFSEGDMADFFQDAGVRLFGGYSRSHPQRSLAVFARSRYGDGSFDYPFFSNRPFNQYESVVLRNSGNAWLKTIITDVVLTGIMEGSAVDVQAARPVATYINGEYWGFYHLREKINEHFVAARYNIDPDSIDLLERNAEVIQGSAEDYLNLMRFIRNNDLQEGVNYYHVSERIDIDNYIQYTLSQIYLDNRDWPGNNIKYWRPQRPGGKWQWILFDTDHGAGLFNQYAAWNNTVEFALATDGPGWPNPPWSTELLRNLLSNNTFRHQFINQFADEMNSRFLPEQVNAVIDAKEAAVGSEVYRAFNRWQWGSDWWMKVQQMRGFFRDRPANVKQHILDQFNLPAYHPVRIEQPDTSQGYIILNSLTLTDSSWTGDYFERVPIKITAIPKPGFSFSHWELDATGTLPELIVNIDDSKAYRPIFLPSVDIVENSSVLLQVTNVRVNPNPLSDRSALYFTVTAPTYLSAALYDINGQYLTTVTNKQFGTGDYYFFLPTQHLPSGGYVLRITENDDKTLVIKLIK